MLKIVVFDSGFGGELFADQLEEELPTVEIIRVIDWRNAKNTLNNPRCAKKSAEVALRPYLGNVDLIIFANYLLSLTSLKYFSRKYKNQKFIGFTLHPKRMVKKPTLIITTKATTRNLAFFILSHHIKAKTICLDSWPLLIDDGELTDAVFRQDLSAALANINNFSPKQILLACGQFSEYIPAFRQAFGHNVRIVDSFEQTIHDTYRALNIRIPKGK